MDMVEKVARAICSELEYDWDNPAVSQFKGTYFRMARAAIKAMREPVPQMVEAGNIPGWDDSVTVGLSEEIWPAMIDAALKEQEKVG